MWSWDRLHQIWCNQKRKCKYWSLTVCKNWSQPMSDPVCAMWTPNPAGLQYKGRKGQLHRLQRRWKWRQQNSEIKTLKNVMDWPVLFISSSLNRGDKKLHCPVGHCVIRLLTQCDGVIFEPVKWRMLHAVFFCEITRCSAFILHVHSWSSAMDGMMLNYCQF